MNFELEKLNELKAIRKELSSLTWMFFVSLFFIIPACIVIIWIGANLFVAGVELSKFFR